MEQSRQVVKKLKTEPEPLVGLTDIMRVYGAKKTYWYEAKDKFGLKSYNVGGIKFRFSEVEEWVQQRSKLGIV